MLEPSNNSELPPIPGKRYFTIGEVSDLCGVKPHVLRYWEQEFPQLKPVKRRGNRRYYQRQDVLIIRQIRSLLYEQGFTIGGARNRLTGDDAQVDLNQSQQLIHQMRLELEELIKILRRLSSQGTERRRSVKCLLIWAIIRPPVGAWRSLVAHLHGVQGVASSNLVAPTNLKTRLLEMIVAK